MRFSKLGQKLTSKSGILSLMEDLGNALSGDQPMLMLGGGNPGQIPAVQALFRARMKSLLQHTADFDRLVGNYDPPDGSRAFRVALADLLRRQFGWDVGYRNIALTNGSQSAFFMLFNLFAGEREQGPPGRILLPLTPEYIGYADVGVAEHFFVSRRPTIELLSEHSFKYHIDFDALEVNEETAAICISRPTNPTGNVLTDSEVQRLVALSERHAVPLIIDNAYGTPFPGIIFTEAEPVWGTHTIVSMSLSKLGLPGVRTGIVIAQTPVIEAMAGMNAIMNLATGGFGPALALDMVRSGDIINIGRDLIRPFYLQKAEQAVAWISESLNDYPVYIHKPEGAIFLWLWFKDLPVSSAELYERLKARGVLVVSGHHFFPGLLKDWPHRHQCLRVTYSQDTQTVRRGLEIIAEEAKRAYSSG